MTAEAIHTVVITGAASGLGRALAEVYHRKGCALALIDVDGEGLQRLKSRFGTGALITTHCADVSMEAEVIAASTAILAAHGRMDVVISNAGISISRTFEGTEEADAQRLFSINFWGCVYMARHFLPALRRAPQGRLVTIASLFGEVGFPGKTMYGASKAAIIAFTRALNSELHGGTVKACYVLPPPLDTGLVRDGVATDAEKRAREMDFMKENGMDLHTAARMIVRGVERGRPRVVVGWRMRVVDLAARCFPGLVQRIVARQAQRLGFS